MSQSREIRSVPDVIRFWAARSPGNVALISDSSTISYDALNLSSNRMANCMLGAGIRPGRHVGYLGMNSDSFFDAWLGAGKIGCAFAPFNWRLAPPELVEIIDDAQPAIIFVEGGSARKCTPFRPGHQLNTKSSTLRRI